MYGFKNGLKRNHVAVYVDKNFDTLWTKYQEFIENMDYMSVDVELLRSKSKSETTKYANIKKMIATYKRSGVEIEVCHFFVDMTLSKNQ